MSRSSPVSLPSRPAVRNRAANPGSLRSVRTAPCHRTNCCTAWVPDSERTRTGQMRSGRSSRVHPSRTGLRPPPRPHLAGSRPLRVRDPCGAAVRPVAGSRTDRSQRPLRGPIPRRNLDGRLTGLDRLIEHWPAAKEVIKRRACEYGLLPDIVTSALACYPERPAVWLVDSDLVSPTQDDTDAMARGTQ